MNLLDMMNPTRWIILACAIGALVLGAFALVDQIGDVREGQVRAEYAAQAVRVDAKRDAVGAPIAAKHEAARVQIQTITKTIVKEIPRYVKADACPVPGGFRVLHDAAANGQVPDAARIPYAAPAGVADVAETVASNYGTYHEVAARLRALQEWVNAQVSLKGPP